MTTSHSNQQDETVWWCGSWCSECTSLDICGRCMAGTWHWLTVFLWLCLCMYGKHLWGFVVLLLSRSSVPSLPAHSTWVFMFYANLASWLPHTSSWTIILQLCDTAKTGSGHSRGKGAVVFDWWRRRWCCEWRPPCKKIHHSVIQRGSESK